MKQEAFRKVARGIALGAAAVGLVVGVAAAPATAGAQQIRHTTSDSTDLWHALSAPASTQQEQPIPADIWLDI